MTNNKYTPSEYDIALGKLLSNTRERFGLTVADCAMICGITESEFIYYESAQKTLTVEMLYKITRFCFNGMTVGAFLGELDTPYHADTTITDIVNALYKLNHDGRKIIATVVNAINPKYISPTPKHMFV